MTLHTDIDGPAHHLDGAERWFYGGAPPPNPVPDPGAPLHDRPGPAPVREPDDQRAPPVREPRPL